MQGNGRYPRFETTMWGDISVGGSVTTPTTSSNVIFSGDNNSITNGTYNTIVGGKNGIISATGTSNCILCGTGNEITGTCSSCSITGGDDNTITNCTAGHIGAGSNNTASGNYSCIPGGRGALADNFGQCSWAGGSFFSAQGDSQDSVFLLRNTAFLSATPHILYLDYPTNTKEIQLGGSSYGVLDLTVIAGKVALNEVSIYRSTYHYTTIAQGLGPFVEETPTTAATPRFFWSPTFISVTSPQPIIQIIGNNILRITVNISSGSNIKILAQVRLTHLMR